MMAFDWKKVVGGIAPTLATALAPGGPVVKAAVQTIGKALLGREDATESDLSKALENGATMDQIVALKQVEGEFQAKMAELGVEYAKIEVEDRGSARQREVALRDWVPAVLAVAVHGAFFGLLGAMLLRALPQGNETPFNILLGMLGTGIASIWSYYFGSSVGSARKDAAIHDVLGKASAVLLACLLGVTALAPAARADAATVLRPLTQQTPRLSAFALERWSVEAALGARSNGWMYSRGTQGFAEGRLRYRWTNAIALDVGARRIAVSKAPLEPEARVVLILAP